MAKVSLNVARAGVTKTRGHLSLAKLGSLVRTAKPNTTEEQKVADDVMTESMAHFMFEYDNWSTLQPEFNVAKAELQDTRVKLEDAHARLDSRATSHTRIEDMFDQQAEKFAQQFYMLTQEVKTLAQAKNT